MCTTCHKPHGAIKNSPILRPDTASPTFCESCHSVPFPHHPVGDVSGGNLVNSGEPHASTRQIKIPPTFPAGITYGKPVNGNLYCSSCHRAHNASCTPILVIDCTKGDACDICVMCHPKFNPTWQTDDNWKGTIPRGPDRAPDRLHGCERECHPGWTGGILRPILTVAHRQMAGVRAGIGIRGAIGKRDGMLFVPQLRRSATSPPETQTSLLIWARRLRRDSRLRTWSRDSWRGRASFKEWLTSDVQDYIIGGDRGGEERTDKYLCTGSHGLTPRTHVGEAGEGFTHPLMNAGHVRGPTDIALPATATFNKHVNCESCHTVHEADSRGGFLILKAAAYKIPSEESAQPAVPDTHDQGNRVRAALWNLPRRVLGRAAGTMKSNIHALTATTAAALILLLTGMSWAAIGGAESKHNFTEINGYSYGSDVCAGRHSSHSDSGKRLSGVREGPLQGNGAVAGPACRRRVSRNISLPRLPQRVLRGPGLGEDFGPWCRNRGDALDARDASFRIFHEVRELCRPVHHVPRAAQILNGSFMPGQNGFMIGSTIKTPNSGARMVIFRAMTGANSMGNEYPTHTSICEVCHTQTLYHKNTASTSHNPGSNCTLCHNHVYGFSAKGNCGSCHGDPPTSQQTLAGRSLKNGYPPTGETSAGMHAFHNYSVNGGAGYACSVCHKGGMSDTGLTNKKIDVKFAAFNVYTSGRFDGFSPISGYTFSAGNTAGGTQSCSNTYCHGNFAGGNKSNAPVWTDSSTGACGTCHAVAPSGLLNHSVHLSAAWGPKAACEDCHPDNSSIGRQAGHVDGVVTFRDGKGFASTTVCNRCHGSGAATAKANWGGGRL